jgi:hypothetical protein
MRNPTPKFWQISPGSKTLAVVVVSLVVMLSQDTYNIKRLVLSDADGHRTKRKKKEQISQDV